MIPLTRSSRAICRTGFTVSLYVIAEVRETTRTARIFERWAIGARSCRRRETSARDRRKDSAGEHGEESMHRPGEAVPETCRHACAGLGVDRPSDLGGGRQLGRLQGLQDQILELGRYRRPVG
jgi:hypothetical protein